MESVLERLRECGVIPVVTVRDLADARIKLGALSGGGLVAAEITLRTECALDAIRLAAAEFPDMLIGAGTVINKKQCADAARAGAKFIVSPGFCTEAAAVCRDRNLPYVPGCVTPTEITAALSAGFNPIKFFPAGIFGGVKALKALSAPFGGAAFVPTGGVNEGNLREYLELPCVFAVGGSWMFESDDFDAIKLSASRAAAAVRSLRSQVKSKK